MGLALLVFFIQGLRIGMSALLGGLTYWVPMFFFLRRMSMYTSARYVARFIGAFFMAEAIKLSLSGVLFVLIIKYCHVQVLAALSGFVGAIIAFWVVSVVCLYQPGMKA